MTPAIYQWHVDLVRDRHQYLDLQFEQAEKIYQYEQEKETCSGKYFLSIWEEWDYEHTTFKEILNDEQFAKYQAAHKRTIRAYEQSLINEDAHSINEIAHQGGLIDFYTTNFLPEIFRNHFTGFGWLMNEKTKIDYLKGEYKKYLIDTKKEILSQHFRHNRLFKPNHLKASLLRHQVSGIFPDYSNFRLHMDEPTKAIAQFLITKLKHIPQEVTLLLARKFNELKTFNDAHFKQHFGQAGGWHVTIGKLTEEEEIEHRCMSLLLLDKDGFTKR